MKLALVTLAWIAATSLPAAADDDVIGPEPPPPDADAAEPAPADVGDVAQVDVEPPAPVATPPVVAAPVEGGHCAWHHWRGHRSRLAGRLALGFSKGHMELDGDREAHQKSLLARVVLRHGFEVELEMAKMTLAGDDVHTGGAALVRTFGHRHLRPYVLVGAGGGRIEHADTDDGGRLHYAEVGGGLMLRKRHLAIGVDVRHGVRHVDDDGDDAMATARSVDPTNNDRETHERYVRGRILALVYF